MNTFIKKEDYINDMAREIIAKIEPNELDIFDMLAQDFYLSQSKSPSKKIPKESELSFGADQLIIPLTPAVLAIIYAVVKFISEILLDSIKDVASDTITEFIKSLIKKEKSSKLSIEENNLYTQTLAIYEAQVKGVISKEAEKTGVSLDMSQQITVIVIKNLHLPKNR